MLFESSLNASALPHFRSNITLLREEENTNRISIPIADKEAHVKYFAIFDKKKASMFSPVSEEIAKIEWQNTN